MLLLGVPVPEPLEGWLPILAYDSGRGGDVADQWPSKSCCMYDCPLSIVSRVGRKRLASEIGVLVGPLVVWTAL